MLDTACKKRATCNRAVIKKFYSYEYIITQVKKSKKMVSVKEILTSKNPMFFQKYPKFFTDFSTLALAKLLKEREINDFLAKNKEAEGLDFVDAVLERLNFTYKFSSRSKINIPSSGKLIIIANHPLGALDALSLIRFIREVRSDVKVVANDILMSVPNLKSLLLGFDITKKSSRNRTRNFSNSD